MWQPLIFILLLIALVKNEPNTWGHSCPTACTCHLTLFKDLSLHRWLKQRGNHHQETRLLQTSKQNNEAFYEEDMYPPDETPDYENVLLKMAMCVLPAEADLHDLFRQIPTDVQVLSLLQGSNTGNISLEFQHTNGFQNLIVLEVLGYDKDEDTKYHSRVRRRNTDINSADGEIILHDNVMKHLTSLQYVNLQNVKLRGEVKKNTPQSIGIPNSIFDINLNKLSEGYSLENEQYFSTNDNANQHFVSFIAPDTSDNEILPYSEYIKEQNNAGLSVFAGLSQLVFLRIVNCGLHKVNWEMFEGLSSLEYLSLERNHLLFLPEFAFHGTPNLKTLSLARNKLLNLHSTCLAGLLELEKLDLSHNNFSHLSELSLPPFPKLHTANFKHNPLEAIFASTFEIMNATSVLYIGGDGSTLDIKPNSFVGLQALKKLNIYNVGVPLLERELLRGMPKLTDLEMTGTINALSYDAFLEVRKLERLVLNHCNLKTISMDAFYGLYSLIHLDLSNNFLESLPPNLFDQQTSLKELLLHNNYLTELPTGFFRNVPAKMIRLDGNPWHCSCAMSDWQPVAINKVKQKVMKFCDFHYDKGSMCKTDHEEYVYDKKVVPRCNTPKKYKNWTVFHTLRKQLRCTSRKYLKAYKKVQLKKQFDSGKALRKQKNEKYQIQQTIRSNLKTSVIPQSEKLPSYADNEPGEPQKNATTKTDISNVVSAYGNTYKLPDMSQESVRKVNFIEQTDSSNKLKSDINNSTDLPSSYNITAVESKPLKVVNVQDNDAGRKKIVPTTNRKSDEREDGIINYKHKEKAAQKSNQSKYDDYSAELQNRNFHKDHTRNVPQKSLNIYDNNGEISKKAWKLELKRKHEEKLRKYAANL
ncbi:slit homolog 2 protein-like [Schistocerca americana]|uniref:slit homolog 2 protein-like n=1 Tax=Schistocerca americana TaxID=7009 RepID=UPI001F503122|nr:slit homolog 2 protein-like [Schistocerca americana]